MKTYSEIERMRSVAMAQYDAMLENAQKDAFINAKTLEDIFSVPLESSSSKTPEYMAVVRKANNRMKKILSGTGWQLLPRNSMPHFEYSVQLKHENGTMAHFFTGDLRGGSAAYGWVVRSIEHEKDWSGGSNRSVNTENGLLKELERISS